VGTFSGPQQAGAAREAKAERRSEAIARQAEHDARQVPVPAPPPDPADSEPKPVKRRTRRKAPVERRG
jgi:hypothetical protein